MAGTISLSLSQQLDQYGNVLAGGRLSFIKAGTVAEPQNAFYDSALTLPLPNPFTLDAAGRIPQFYLADGSIKVVLTDKHGVEQFEADNVLVIGPSSGGGGGGSVDPTTVLQTGQVALWYGTGVRSGFTRLNGRSIGSATSGATERANADTQAQFLFLWAADAGIGILTISGGRGLSAAADWAANKTITLPDARNRAPAGLGDMGNSDSGLFAGLSYTLGGSTILGSLVGAARRTLLAPNLPPYTPSGTNSTATSAGLFLQGGVSDNFTSIGGSGQFANLTKSNVVVPGQVFVGNPQGGTSAPFDTISPYLLLTLYMKL